MVERLLESLLAGGRIPQECLPALGARKHSAAIGAEGSHSYRVFMW
jgi:hypothetical protein